MIEDVLVHPGDSGLIAIVELLTWGMRRRSARGSACRVDRLRRIMRASGELSEYSLPYPPGCQEGEQEPNGAIHKSAKQHKARGAFKIHTLTCGPVVS